MPFNDTVNATFKTEEPLEVLAGCNEVKYNASRKGVYWRRVLCILQLTNTLISQYIIYTLKLTVKRRIKTVHKITKNR